jgi:4-amino-4-deoxy-L-arabinose transferase-like glycosyltransferase
MSVGSPSPSPTSRRPRSAKSPLVLLWLVGLTCLLRFPVLVSHPFCIDESYYAAGAVELNAGGAFYRDVVDHKSPGIYFIYAFIYRLAGAYNQTAVHLALLLVAALTAYLVGLCAAELFGARVGRWAGTLYALASVIGPANDFQAANTELFMNLPVVAALWLCARGAARRERAGFEWPVGGFLVGLAILIRPQAALALLPLGVAMWRRRVRWSVVGTVALAAALPSLALLASVWRAGAIADLRASLTYASYYSSCLPFEVKLANGSLKTLFFAAIDLGLMIPVAMLLWRGRRSDAAWQQGAGALLLTWLGASLVAVAAGGRFYPHYFIQALPPLVIMAARQLLRWREETPT